MLDTPVVARAAGRDDKSLLRQYGQISLSAD